MKAFLQQEENASDYPVLPLFHMMNLNSVFLLDICMQNISLYTATLPVLLYFRSFSQLCGARTVSGLFFRLQVAQPVPKVTTVAPKGYHSR